MQWLSDERIAEARRVWSKAYGRVISDDEAVEILMNVRRLAEVLLRAEQERPGPKPRAKNVIFLFMVGGVSHLETFDHKPLLAQHAGERPQLVNRKSLRNTKGGLFPSPFGFKQYGETGKWVSDLFPHVGQHVDELCFIHSMHTKDRKSVV